MSKGSLSDTKIILSLHSMENFITGIFDTPLAHGRIQLKPQRLSSPRAPA